MMGKIELELTPAADVERIEDPGLLAAYTATADEPQFKVEPLPADLPFGLYRLSIETTDAERILDPSVILASVAEVDDPMAIRATFERFSDRLDAFFVLPPHCRSIRFALNLEGDVVRIGVATLDRVSTTRRRLQRLRGAFRRWGASPASLGKEIAEFGDAVRKTGSVAVKRQIAEALNPTRILPIDGGAMLFGRVSRLVAARNRLALAKAASWTRARQGVSLSIVVPVYRTPKAWLGQLLASFEAQTDQDFELVLVFDGPQEELRAFAESSIAGTFRWTSETLAQNSGVSAASNTGICKASGDYVVVVDHDDLLERHFVEAFRLAAETRPADIYFADEAVTNGDMSVVNILATRSKFDIRFYLSHPYIVHPIFVRRDIALRAGLFDEALKVSHDVDFFLRCVAEADKVVQIPLLIYYWRTHEGSLGHARAQEVSRNTRAAITGYLSRKTDWEAFEVRDGINFNEYDVRPPLPSQARVAIIIPTKNRRSILSACLASLYPSSQHNRVPFDIYVVDHQSDDAKTVAYLEREAAAGRIGIIPYEGPWNYAAINNAAVKVALSRGDYTHLVFMNNDIEMVTDDWLDRMVAQFSYRDVGVVGCCLQYPDGRVQHAGVVIGLVGAAEHSHKFEPMRSASTGRRLPSHLSSLVATRDYNAVTAALMAVPVGLFEAVGGFDETLAVGFNDTDLCLRIGALGLHSTYVGSVVATHHESISRGFAPHIKDTNIFLERYGEIIESGDEYWPAMLDRSWPSARFSLKAQTPFRLPETPLHMAKITTPARAGD